MLSLEVQKPITGSKIVLKKKKRPFKSFTVNFKHALFFFFKYFLFLSIALSPNAPFFFLIASYPLEISLFVPLHHQGWSWRCRLRSHHDSLESPSHPPREFQAHFLWKEVSNSVFRIMFNAFFNVIASPDTLLSLGSFLSLIRVWG